MGTIQKHDSKTIDQAIERIASAIATRHAKTKRLILLGIANGGVIFAERLVGKLRKAGLRPGLGTVDISFHRDDISHHPIPKEYSPTLIPHDINGAAVILVDDVLHTGRTVKAALDELFDHGRPSGAELAVLADRGGRKLPVAPDYCGVKIDATDAEDVVVHLDPRVPTKDSISVISASKPKIAI